MENEHLKLIRMTPEAFGGHFIQNTQGWKCEKGLSADFKLVGFYYNSLQHCWELVFSDGKHTEGSLPEEFMPVYRRIE